MPTRMTCFVPAILAICLAAVCLTAQKSRAADDCLAKPNAPSPQGSHWYYRVDRATHRECWYLGAEGTKVRVRARQAGSPVRPPAPHRISQPTVQPPSEAAEAAPAEIPAAIARTAEGDPPAALSVRWSGLPTSAASLDRAPVSMRNNYAEEQPTTDSQDEMPLIWPILTPAELGATERPTALTISFAQLAVALFVVLGLAALIVRVIFRLSAVRSPGGSQARHQWRFAASIYRPGKQVSPTFPEATVRGQQPGMARRTIKATPPPSDPAAEIEASVRLLLHELQQRRHENRRRNFERTSGTAMA
jgi:hypothetical protein